MATTSNQLVPGMVISLKNGLFRIESAVKVTVAKGNPFIKTRLKNLMGEEFIEKNFKLNQAVKEVSLVEKQLEYLYLEGQDYLFLDTSTLDTLIVSHEVVGSDIDYLKEGIRIKATFYGENIFSVELPQYLELMVAKTEEREPGPVISNATKIAILETGAKLEVPLFIEEGDVVKVDTRIEEYIQRI